MKFRKTLIVITSLLGVYNTVRKYQKHRRPTRVKTKQTIKPANKYVTFTSQQVREEFKNRIAAGEWLTEDEYTHMIEAMKKK